MSKNKCSIQKFKDLLSPSYPEQLLTLKFTIYYLSVRNDPDDFAVLDNFLEVSFNGFLAQIIWPLLRGFCESLLLAVVPIAQKIKPAWSKLSSGTCHCNRIYSGATSARTEDMPHSLEEALLLNPTTLTLTLNWGV